MIDPKKLSDMIVAVQNASYRCGEYDDTHGDEIQTYPEVMAESTAAEEALRDYILQAVGCLEHPNHVEAAPYVVGRWMVTGPDFEDGSGWTLCIHQDQKCQRCVATFSHQADAEHAAKLHDLWELRVVNIEKPTAPYQALRLMSAELALKNHAPDVHAQHIDWSQSQGITSHMAVKVNPDQPKGTITFLGDSGQEVGRIVGIAQEPEIDYGKGLIPVMPEHRAEFLAYMEKNHLPKPADSAGQDQ